MYLHKLGIEGFRCFGKTFDVDFMEGLNVVVGENGAGKTAIISAIRQLFHDSESGRFSVTSDDFFSPSSLAERPQHLFLFQLSLTGWM